jgi:hypothetical protein
LESEGVGYAIFPLPEAKSEVEDFPHQQVEQQLIHTKK